MNIEPDLIADALRRAARPNVTVSEIALSDREGDPVDVRILFRSPGAPEFVSRGFTGKSPEMKRQIATCLFMQATCCAGI